jgi:membrane associated rhomboid family serine protease
MEPTKQDAAAMLEEAGGIQLAVRTRTPKEHVPYFAWGLSMALLWPIRDLGDDSVLGGILMWIVMGGAVALLITYLRQFRQVRVRPRTPIWLALALGAWVVAATTFLPGLLDGTTNFAYSLGGILGAVPLLLWAERLRRNA